MRLLVMYRYNCIKLLRSPRTWVALCLAAAIGMGVSQDYYRLCVSSALPANVLESFIIGANYRLCGIFHPINLCFMLSEAPFMDENAAYMIFRSGRRAWYLQGVLLVVTACVAYYLFVLLSSCILMISISYAPNIWSGPAILLSDGRHGLTNGVNMPRGILSAHSPLTATLSQLGLYIIYTLPLALLYFALTINMRRAYAFAMPVLLHALMLIVFMDGIYAMYSLFSYLFLSFWLEWSAPYRAYFICVCVCVALSALIIGVRGARRMDVHNLAILWLK